MADSDENFVDALHDDNHEIPLTDEQFEAYKEYEPIPEFDVERDELPELLDKPYTAALHYPAVKKEFIHNLETLLENIRVLKTDPSLEVTKDNFDKVVKQKEEIEEYVADIVNVIGDKTILLQDIFHYLFDRSEWLLDKKNAEIARLNAEIASLKAEVTRLLAEKASLDQRLREAQTGSAAEIASHDAEIKRKLDELNAKLKALLNIGPSVVTSSGTEIGSIRTGSSRRRPTGTSQHLGGTKHNKKYRK